MNTRFHSIAVPLMFAGCRSILAEPSPALGNERLADKTLVVWVSPANLIQRGGSALTIEDAQGHFDGIVFGEIVEGKWMAGSDLFARTEPEQSAFPIETEAPEAPLTLKSDEEIVFRVFVDQNVIEVFANERQAVVVSFDTSGGESNVSLLCDGGDASVRSVKSWLIDSIY